MSRLVVVRPSHEASRLKRWLAHLWREHGEIRSKVAHEEYGRKIFQAQVWRELWLV